MSRTLPEYEIELLRQGNEWIWKLSDSRSKHVLVEGTADSPEDAHACAHFASIWLSNPIDEDDWI